MERADQPNQPSASQSSELIAEGLTLRARLALLLAAVLCVCFSLFGWLHYENMHLALLKEVDETLVLRAGTVAELLSESGVTQARQAAKLNLDDSTAFELDSAPEVYVELIEPGGRIVNRSSNLHGLSLPTPEVLKETSVTIVRTESGLRLRRMVVPFMVGQNHILSIVVGESLQLLDAALSRAAQRTVAIGLLTLLLTFYFCGLALNRGLTPLARLANTIETITRTGDLSRRVRVTSDAGEIGKVAHSFNVLLDRVEDVLDTQKEFLADTSHELRNPLTVIQTDLDLLGRELDEQTRKEVAEEASRETRRMIQLVSDLLQLSWAKTEIDLREEMISLTALTRRTVERMQPLAQNVDLTFEDSPEVDLLADPSRVEQILVNLISNALRHTPGGRVKVRIFVDAGQVYVEVEDTGCGIAREHQEKIFQRFHRVDKSRCRESGGTGLGLPLARALARAHDGDVTVRSSPEIGSTFTFQIPLESIES